jgi:hypothetical protein
MLKPQLEESKEKDILILMEAFVWTSALLNRIALKFKNNQKEKAPNTCLAQLTMQTVDLDLSHLYVPVLASTLLPEVVESEFFEKRLSDF